MNAPHNHGLGRYWELSADDVRAFALGASFMGCGGGGDPYIGRLLLESELAKGGTIRLVDVEDVPDDWLAAGAGAAGAPTVLLERFPNIGAAETALRKLETHLGRKLDAVLAGESGGINATIPLILALRTGLPLIDCDGMGRAFPELQMVTFNIYGYSASPLIFVDDHGDSVIIESSDNRKIERLGRQVIIGMHGGTQGTLYPLSGAAVKHAAVRGTLTLALEIGKLIQKARHADDPAERIVAGLNTDVASDRHAARLCAGKIVDVDRKTSGGFSRGYAVIECATASDGPVHVQFQNEHLLALGPEGPLAMVPDLIVMLDSETGVPITAETMRYGQRIALVGLSVPAMMRTPEALAVFGPRAFGLDHDYQPLERLSAGSSPAAIS
ncbi:DUF917 domain-containing protein [Parasphingopyxis algicola]|uniref:DUF917 domain-containing protein n=1 Tax=Parasphingopyxis algicola TaxID=2026624 RepID=UPI0015A0EC1F|nr:DUF917 domain-containing protein [Parasphingopyxis algicola]QLC24889.1 DUF917 domain-containing protein [Parasphingopyxis algicola]